MTLLSLNRGGLVRTRQVRRIRWSAQELKCKPACRVRPRRFAAHREHGSSFEDWQLQPEEEGPKPTGGGTAAASGGEGGNEEFKPRGVAVPRSAVECEAGAAEGTKGSERNSEELRAALAEGLAPLIQSFEAVKVDVALIKEEQQRQAKEQQRQAKEQQRQGRDLGRVAETLARTAVMAHKQSQDYAVPMAIGSESKLAEVVSVGGQHGSADALVQAVLQGHCGYAALERLVLAKIQEEELPQLPEIKPFLESVAAAQGWAGKDVCWQKLLGALDSHRRRRQQQQQQMDAGAGADQRVGQGQREGAWWERHGRLAQGYCATAASDSKCLPDFLRKSRREYEPAFVLAAALAANVLRLELELDGVQKPLLNSSSLTFRLLEAKCNAAGMSEGAHQLHVAARLLVWALHTCNPQLVPAGREVVVEGTVGVLGSVGYSAQQEWERTYGQPQQVQVFDLPRAELRLQLEGV